MEIFFSFAFKIHLLEEYRNFYLLHMKKMEWFSKLSNEDRNHKAMLTKNKYKVPMRNENGLNQSRQIQ